MNNKKNKMENNIWNLLDADPEKQDEPQDNNDMKGNMNGEKTLQIIANVILVFGIIATIIMLFTVAFHKPIDYGDREFSLSGFLYTIVTLVSSIITWAVFTVLCHISINLFNIKDSIEKNIK